MLQVDVSPLASSRAALLAAAMAHLATAGAEYVTPVRRLMHTLLSNVLKAPDEVKVRRVKLQHPQIASMLGGDPAALLVLELCGFAVSDDGMKAQMPDSEVADVEMCGFAVSDDGMKAQMPDSEVADVEMLQRRLRVLSHFQQQVGATAETSMGAEPEAAQSEQPIPSRDDDVGTHRRKHLTSHDSERRSRRGGSSRAHASHPHLHA